MHPDLWENEMSNLLAGGLDGSQISVTVGETELTCLAALSAYSRQVGLSGKSELPEDGMIFICPNDSDAKFIRAGMEVDISIWFFDKHGSQVGNGWDGDFATPETSYRYVIETRPELELQGTLTSLKLVS